MLAAGDFAGPIRDQTERQSDKAKKAKQRSERLPLLILFVAIHIPRSLWLELDRTMSDLLPLVAAALQDNVAVEAAKEISALRKEREDAHKVEVLRARNNGNDEDEDDPVVVYASAPFESGEYGVNTNMSVSYTHLTLPTILRV